MNSKALIPPAWDYNPSAWRDRIPLLLVASVGFCIAMYLGLYQLHVFTTVWEPFFENGTHKALTSFISKTLPIPDGILGAIAYATDVISGAIGGQARWKTKPWIVIIFGLAVGPLGMVSILLVIIQPVVLHTWCTLCLCSAAISVFMIGPALDEVLASLQFLQRVKLSGNSVWKAFCGNKQIINQIQ